MLKRVSISDTKEDTDDCRDLPVPTGDCTSPPPEDDCVGLGVVPALIEEGLIGGWELGVLGLKDGLAL